MDTHEESMEVPDGAVSASASDNRPDEYTSSGYAGANIRKFVYSLLYPAILGSMMYQVVYDPAHPYWSGEWWVQILIVLIYVADWFFIVTARLGRATSEAWKLWLVTIADFVSVWAFLTAFVLARECPQPLWGVLAPLISLGAVYLLVNLFSNRRVVAGVAFAEAALLTIDGLIATRSSLDPTVTLIVTLSIVVAVYAILDLCMAFGRAQQ